MLTSATSVNCRSFSADKANLCQERRRIYIILYAHVYIYTHSPVHSSQSRVHLQRIAIRLNVHNRTQSFTAFRFWPLLECPIQCRCQQESRPDFFFFFPSSVHWAIQFPSWSSVLPSASYLCVQSRVRACVRAQGEKRTFGQISQEEIERFRGSFHPFLPRLWTLFFGVVFYCARGRQVEGEDLDAFLLSREEGQKGRWRVRDNLQRKKGIITKEDKRSSEGRYCGIFDETEEVRKREAVTGELTGR